MSHTDLIIWASGHFLVDPLSAYQLASKGLTLSHIEYFTIEVYGYLSSDVIWGLIESLALEAEDLINESIKEQQQ